jgi:hypothetical protein
VLIATADVRDHHLENHSVVDLLPERVDQFRIVDAANFNLTGADVDDATIAWHDGLLL